MRDERKPAGGRFRFRFPCEAAVRPALFLTAPGPARTRLCQWRAQNSAAASAWSSANTPSPPGPCGRLVPERRSPVPGRFVVTGLAVFSFPLVCASSGTASEISFDGEVLRYHERPREHYGMVVGLRGSAEPPYLRIQLGREEGPVSRRSVRVAAGCHWATTPLPWDEVLHCPLGVSDEQPRYRLTLGALKDEVTVNEALDGVVYGGGGFDDINGADLVYGGPGPDYIELGTRVYGGTGGDFLLSVARRAATEVPVAYGGPGSDSLSRRGLLYGGPGNDGLPIWVPNCRRHAGRRAGPRRMACTRPSARRGARPRRGH